MLRRVLLFMCCCVIESVSALEAPPDLQFDVVRYEVTGSNAMSSAEVTNILKPYLGRHYSLAGLSSAVEELERHLKKKGYSFHRVVLIPQSLRNGIVKLHIYEFKLGALKVSGNQYFSDENIKHSLPSLIEGQAPNTRLLNKSLSIANHHPDKSLQMIFKEGEKQNTIDVELKVADKTPATGYVQLANTGSENSGETRLGLGYQYSNLFNKDHVANINYSTSTEQPENVSQWVLSYSMPFYDIGDKLSFYYSDSKVESLTLFENNPGLFDVSGIGSVLGMRYTLGFLNIKSFKQKVTLGLDVKEFNNRISSADFGGAIDESTVRSGPVSIEYEFSRPKGRSPFALSVSYHHNQIDDEAYLLQDRAPDTNWGLTRYRAQYDMPLSDWLLRFKLSGQYADRALISAEQFTVGGSRSVRGYEEVAALGDRGHYFNLELWKKIKSSHLSGAVFYDSAQTELTELTDTNISAPLKNNLASMGVGLRWSWSRYLAVSADLAQVQQDFGETLKGDSKLHFNMTYKY
ncbi:MAG: BamA/TamA family outer membrane protein [Gammaproteobacteria bacterium]|nr:BamA/TamA family outer membrane protein [Gammaproteobacteria bacterium]